ncbi:MAG: hypothetical protein E7578_05610 [Ruminococcaceae bacterium]|nr:hypothetical protein [Oscillospiraceae bacterium]
MDNVHVLDGVTNGEKYLIYKGRPLVRENNTIVYGCAEEKYVLQITIMTTTEYAGNEVPDKVIVQVVNTDTNLPMGERIAKQDMKSGLSEAFEIGVIWLERLLAS